jgi:hypothetical protein
MDTHRTDALGWTGSLLAAEISAAEMHLSLDSLGLVSLPHEIFQNISE